MSDNDSNYPSGDMTPSTGISVRGYEPKHLSYSTVDGFRTCGKRFELQKVIGVEQRPGLAALGGNAIHTASELYDLGVLAGQGDTIPSAEELFIHAWEQEVANRREQSPSYELDDYVKTGRASAAYGGKRGVEWWMDNGPGMVQKWIDWRAENNWAIWETPEGKPAVELELNVTLPGNIPIKMFIDRVMVTPVGQITVVDLKGLATNTLLATPEGWTTMGEVKVGDAVMGTDGRPCRVTAKSDVKWLTCFRVTFDDGTSLVCDDEHLWETAMGLDGRRGYSTEVRSVRDISNTLDQMHRIKMPEPLELPDADLPLDPYVLGCWLGDGNRSRGVITKPDQDLFDEIVRRGYPIGIPQIDSRTGCQSRTVLGLQTTLRSMGVLGDKHIPAQYLRASVAQRLDLLRGLMDTDGTYNQARDDVRFCTVDKAMAYAVEELALSLGERVRTFEVQRSGFGKTVTSHDVIWKPQRFNPFTLPRKAARVDLSSTSSIRSRQRIIKSIVEVPSVPTQCIAVDSADSMYLAGDHMVPTHNTGRIPETAEQLGLYAYGIGQEFGDMFRPDWGYFWNPDKGHGSPLDLSPYTGEYLADIARGAVRGINAEVFLAKPANNCKAWCGVAQFCPAVGGTMPSFSTNK